MIIGKAFRIRPIFKGENKNLDIPRVGMSKIENQKDQSVMLLANFYGIWIRNKKQTLLGVYKQTFGGQIGRNDLTSFFFFEKVRNKSPRCWMAHY